MLYIMRYIQRKLYGIEWLKRAGRLLSRLNGGSEASSSAKEHFLWESQEAAGCLKLYSNEVCEMEKVGSNQVAQSQPETEFSIVCRAKNGDQDAVEWIWRKYRKLMVGMIGKYWWYHRLSEGEMESEATMAMLHKLEIFKPERVKKSPEEWEFKYMLINAAYHCRSRLKTAAKRKQEEDGESFEEIEEYSHDRTMLKDMVVNNEHQYYVYNPEDIAIRSMDETPEEKAERLMSMLTPIQKTLLELRRKEMTVQEIADHMGWGFTKVRKQIVQARELAHVVFGV